MVSQNKISKILHLHLHMIIVQLIGNRFVLKSIAILLIFQLGFTCLASFHALFRTSAIGLAVWMRMIVVASSVLFLVELESILFGCAVRKKHMQ